MRLPLCDNSVNSARKSAPTASPPVRCSESGWRPIPPLHWYCLLALITLALHLADLYRLDPDHSLAGYLAEGGPFQNLQLLLLGWSLALSVWALWRLEGTARGAMVFLVGPLFYLFWREADWDKDIFSAWFGVEQGVRMFSWRYLWKGGELPWQLRLVWGVVSLGLVATWGWACWRARKAGRTFWQIMTLIPVWFWLALAVLCLAASQAAERLSLLPPSPARDPYLEEAPELLGELALLCFVIHFFEAAKRISPSPRSGPTASPAPGPAV